MPAKRLSHIRATKTKSGSRFFYDTKRKKRISKKEHTRRLKISKARFPPVKRKPTKKRKPKQIRIKTFKGRTTRGNDYFKRVRINLDDIEISQVEERFEEFFIKVSSRLQIKDRITFGNIKGFYVTADDDEVWERNTKTYDFKDSRTDYLFNLGEGVKKTLEDLKERIGKVLYEKGEVETFIITRLKVSIRRQV